MRKSCYSLVTLIVSGLAAAVISFSAYALPFSNLFVFGDSLSDSGNVALATGGLTEPIPFSAGHSLVPSAPYAEGGGRFSNGPVWVEQLASNLGLSALPSLAGGTNFAFGGARTGPSLALPTPPLVDQLAGFLSVTGGVAPSDALYTVWGGSNDILDAVVLAATDLSGAGMVVTDAVTNIASMVSDLAGAGAVNILVPNLPDIGLTPAVIRAGAAAVGAGSLFSGMFNSGLASALDPFFSDPLLNIIPLDIFNLVNSVVASPGAFGLLNATDSCVDIGSICGNPGDYLFWDGIHPTTVAHGVVAQLALAKVVPEPATLLLLVLGIIFMCFIRKNTLTAYIK